MTALGALDIALWDLEGKRLGVPVYRLLGGPYRTELRGYASHWLAGATTPDQAYAGAQEAVRRGFTAFKWSPFDPALLRTNEARAIRQAAELMAAARAGAGSDVEIYIECAERLSPRSAVLAAQALLPYRPGWFEEPIPFENPQAMVQLQRDMPVPIATGERLLSRWEVRALLEGGGCQVLQPDVMHAGGITEVKRMANLADLSYVPIASHNPGGPICMLAAMHLAAAIPNFLILEQMEDERALRDQICTNPVRYHEGMFALPTTPGLGTDLLLDQLAEHRARPQPTSGSSESLWH
jgi:galactonate dehydratase